MKLAWGLGLALCHVFMTHFTIDACSMFPSHMCYSSPSIPKSDNHSLRSTSQPNSIFYEYLAMADTSTMNQTLPKHLRILCFGDSLTAGYTSSGWEHYPYADHLRVGLEHMLSSSDIRVDVAGLSGDQVQGRYLRRIKAKCASAAQDPYDWIVIMGGTNDLGWGQQPTAIYDNLS